MIGASSFLSPSVGNNGLSREFFDLVKGIGESRSKQEEDRIMTQEVATLKTRLSDPTSTRMHIKEYLARALYAEMLGHETSFAHIHAVKLASDKNILCKRTGYMLCGLSFRPQNELLLLLVNTIQKDLGSSDFLEVAAALNCCAQISHTEAIPVLVPSVINLLAHSKDMIRRKTLAALLTMYNTDTSILADFQEPLKRAIHDSDPGVTSAALDLIGAIWTRRTIDEAANEFCTEFQSTLVPTLSSILRDIVNHRLPRDWDFHRVPAPWLQIKIINLIAVVVGADQVLAEEVYEVLRTVITRADLLHVNIGFAITFECIKTISTIYPLPALCELAANAVTRFIESENRNLQLAGIVGLINLVKVDVSYVTKHQLAVIDCLDDCDETLRSKALELLAETTNSSNVRAVVGKLLDSAELYTDSPSKRELVTRAVELTERYSPDHQWYLATMTRMFLNFSPYIPIPTAHSVIRLIAEGPMGDDVLSFRREAVASAIKVAERMRVISDSALLVAFWTLGTFGHSLKPSEYSSADILDLLTEALTVDRTFILEDTRLNILNAVLKHAGHMCLDLIWNQSDISARAVLEGKDEMPGWYRELRSLLNNILLGLDPVLKWHPDMNQKVIEFFAMVVDKDRLQQTHSLRLPILTLERAAQRVEECSRALRLPRQRRVQPPPPVTKPTVTTKPLKFQPYQSPPRDPEPSPAVEQPAVSREVDFRVASSGRWDLTGLQPSAPAVAAPVSRPVAAPVSRPVATAVKPADDLAEKQRKANELFAGVTSRGPSEAPSSTGAEKTLPPSLDLLDLGTEDKQSDFQDVSVATLPTTEDLPPTLHLSPIDKQVEEIASTWSDLPREVRSEWESSADINDVVSVLKSAGFAVAQIIGGEAICAAKCREEEMFLYAKTENGKCTLMLRTHLSESEALMLLSDVKK